MPERPVAQPLQVSGLGVVGAVDDAQVFTAADLQAGLHQALVTAGQVGCRLDHHALAAGRGQGFPPARGVLQRSRVTGVGDAAAGRAYELGVGGDEPVGDLQMPAVRLVLEGGTSRGEQLERGQLHTGEPVGRPAVAPVGGAEGVGVRTAGARALEQLGDVAALPGGLRESGYGGGQRGAGRCTDRGVLRLQQVQRLRAPRHQLGVEHQPVTAQLLEESGSVRGGSEPGKQLLGELGA